MQERHINRKKYFEEQSYTTTHYVIPFIKPFIGIKEEIPGFNVVYSATGSLSVIMRIYNPGPQYGADSENYEIEPEKLHRNADHLRWSCHSNEQGVYINSVFPHSLYNVPAMLSTIAGAAITRIIPPPTDAAANGTGCCCCCPTASRTTSTSTTGATASRTRDRP